MHPTSRCYLGNGVVFSPEAFFSEIEELKSHGVDAHRLSGRLNFPRRIATAYWNAAVWTLHNRFADAVEASLKDIQAYYL